MPLQSEAQRRWMWANDPEMARRWEAETPKGKLPARKKRKSMSAIEERIAGLEELVVRIGVMEFRDYSQKQRDQLVKEHKAMGGGRYPIKNQTDLDNAARAWPGRGGKSPRAKAWILQRARELDLTDWLKGAHPALFE